MKEHVHLMFTAVLFTMVKIWKQPKCPSIDEWMKQLWDIYTVEYCSAIKTKRILPFVTVWIDLDKATTNIHFQVFYRCKFSSYLSKYQRMELVNCTVRICLILLEITRVTSGGFAMLHSHQQWMSVPVASHLHQHLVVLVFWILDILIVFSAISLLVQFAFP